MDKKNTNYAASAVNMTNHESITGMLDALHNRQEYKVKLEDELKSLNAELYSLLENCNKEIGLITNDIRLSIDQRGSYQDLDKGWYAVKQRAVSKSYDAKIFKEQFPKFVPLVIVETVNEKALIGLIKGGLISETELSAQGVTKESESFRYIIK